MNIGDKLHGFTVLERHELSNMGATLYVMNYERCGARLIYMDREDENKTFSISFRTLPSDSTGVFHILEHSVLCGSEKYRLKDPFVELLSGSLNTFLNAMTFKDKTMYPVASTNEKEFLSLADVYLDAVFHPLAVRDKKAFMQEGWHYEIDGSGELSYKGVVLNEMRGDYSSAESVTDRHMAEMLFKDTSYSHDSGGDPECITDLTFEQFKEAHDVWYHPSNAVIFLDGSMDIVNILSLISGYLSEYDRRDYSDERYAFRLAEKRRERRECEYEINEGEDTCNKLRLALGHLTFRFDDRENIFGTAILSSALFSSNESEIKKKMLSSGLCEDMQINVGEGIYQNYFEVDFINVTDGRAEELEELFYSTVREIAERGIDRAQLEAAINSTEFFLRERDYGSLPLGIIYAMNLLESYLYSDDALSGLTFEREIAFLRENLDTGFFERLLMEIFCDNESRAVLLMHPKKDLSVKMQQREREKLRKIRESMSDDGMSSIIKDNEELLRWQSTEDSEEAKASIPRLKVSDIDPRVSSIPTRLDTVDGVTVISHTLPTNRITYTDMYFDVSDISKDELFSAALLGLILGNLETENYTAPELLREIKSELGVISFSLRFATRTDGTPKIHAKLYVSCLDGKRDSAARLAEEFILNTVFRDKEAMRSIVKQAYIASEESFAAAGHRIAKARVSAMLYSEAAAKEYYSGYEAHRSFKKLCENFDSQFPSLCESLKAFISKYIIRERLTVSVTCTDPIENAAEYVESLISIFPRREEKCDPKCTILPLEKRNEGIKVSAKVAFCSLGMNVLSDGGEASGAFDVASNLISYEYLWGEIRVKGGAYGAGMGALRTGFISFYSYRDPSARNTIEVFSKTADVLKAYSVSGRSVDKYIIGAIGETSPYLTARSKGNVGTARYLNGLTDEQRQKTRDEILSADSESIGALAEMMKRSLESAPFCVVGPKDKLSELEGMVDVILEI